MVLSALENEVTPLVLANGINNTPLGLEKGITNTALGLENAIDNNLALVWENVLGNMGLGWAREITSLVWGKGTNSSMGLALAKETSMVMNEGNECLCSYVQNMLNKYL